MTSDTDKVALRVACGSYLLANEIARRESDEERRRKMARVVVTKRAAIADTFPQFRRRPPGIRDARAVLGRARWKRSERDGFLIELSFTYPFLPYELKVDEEDLWTGITAMSKLIGADPGYVDEIRARKRDAEKALKYSSPWRKLAYGGGALAGVALIAAAPWAVAALGAATASSGVAIGGAAATAHGLALLGGGSLAAGGTGMVGGMAVASATGVTALGVAGVSAKQLIDELPPEAVAAQLVKAMVAFALIDLGTETAEGVIAEIQEQREELARSLRDENNLNESKAGRVQAIEHKLRSYDRALVWMREQHAGGQ